MKNSKKLPTKQLEKFSTVFMQLGLVLTLFIVYTLLEHQTEIKSLAYEPPREAEPIYLSDDTQNVIIQKEVKVKPKVKVIPPKFFDLDDIKKGDNDIIENPFPDIPVDEDPVLIDIDDIVFVDEPKVPEPETVPYILIEDAPIFKGCEGLSKEENKKCFEKSITKFVLRNFDAGLAQELGLHSGKHKMYSQFIIDKKGDIIDIVVKAPHKQLEKEAKRIISKLPQFTPGKQQRKPVKVKYTLPISFNVE
jgi:protein TonB